MITQLELKNIIKTAFDAESIPGITPSEARERIATQIASGVALFVQGRTTLVTTTGTATAQTGTGIIQ